MLMSYREAKRSKTPLSLGYHGNIVDLWERLFSEYQKTGELLVDLGSDQTSLHNPFNGGYYPVQLSFSQANQLMSNDPDRFRTMVQESLRRHIQAINQLSDAGMFFWDYGNAFLLEAQRAGAEVKKVGGGATEFRYPSYVQHIMGDIFSLGFGPFRWVCTSGDAQDLRVTDDIAASVLEEISANVTDRIRQQYSDNIRWIREAGKHKMVVGSQARILYSDQRGRVSIALAINRAVADGRVSAPVVISRDHHDVSGTDSPFRETSNVYDGSAFCADMAVQNFVGDAFRGATWVALHNGGGVGWGEVMNGGFGLLLDGSEEAEQRARLMLNWDVSNGVARRCWSGNSNAYDTIQRTMEEHRQLRVTMPFPVQDERVLERALQDTAYNESSEFACSAAELETDSQQLLLQERLHSEEEEEEEEEEDEGEAVSEHHGAAVMASALVPGCSVMSDLLTIREKGILFTLLPPEWKLVPVCRPAAESCDTTFYNVKTLTEEKCDVSVSQLIKTTVAQVLEAKQSGDEAPGWCRVGCGVVCLIEDESVHSYFLRLYCVKRAKLLWEQEVYVPFKYTATRSFFHTFPADGHQVGFNFADETEAEEFELSVKAVQRRQDMFMTKTVDNETVNPPEPGDQCFSEEAPVSVSPPASSPFKDLDLDPAIRRLLVQAELPVEELKDKDVAEAVDCIINRFGGLKAVQGALRGRGLASQTLPRAAGASISTALRKGPLPPVPSITGSTSIASIASSQQTPPGPREVDQILHIPPPPPAPAPVLPERIRKSTSFRYAGSSADRDRSDLILTALRNVFIQKGPHGSRGDLQL
ncbi:hypothetical protein INR49_011945 [Caranx melampygus]|nr:hypothetical protein INR49_011945 [Caranx melampygus]